MLLSLDATLDLSEQLMARCLASKGGRVTFRYGPACENSASSDLLREVRALADQNQTGIHIHVAESKFGWDNIHELYGKTPVRYLHDLGLLGPDVLGTHCIWLTDEDVEILKETGTTVSYNPECHMKLALGIAPVTKMLEAGVAVSLGTDTCAVNDDMDLFEAMRAGAFLQKISTMDPAVLPAYEALELGTIGGARALGMEDEIGSLGGGEKGGRDRGGPGPGAHAAHQQLGQQPGLLCQRLSRRGDGDRGRAGRGGGPRAAPLGGEDRHRRGRDLRPPEVRRGGVACVAILRVGRFCRSSRTRRIRMRLVCTKQRTCILG